MSSDKQRIQDSYNNLLSDGKVIPLCRHKMALGDKMVGTRIGGQTNNLEELDWLRVFTSNMSNSSILYENNLWVVVGPTGFFASTDGLTYERTVDISTMNNTTLIYKNNVWVATGGQGIFTSTDGLTWERRTTLAMGSQASVLYENNIWVAIGHSGIFTSTDGLTWERPVALSGAPSFLYENNLWVVAGNGGIFTSMDGLTWERRATNHVNEALIFYKNNVWVVVAPITIASPGGGILVSTDGLTWERRVTLNMGANPSFLYENNLLVVAGASGIFTSTDGLTWERRTTLNASNPSILYENNIWVVVGNGGIFTSIDGLTWGHPVTLNMWHASLLYKNNVLVVTGTSGILVSTDGLTWKHPVTLSMAESSILYENNLWVVAGDSGIFTSTDGLTWERPVTLNLTNPSLRYDNNLWVAAGLSGIFTSVDGQIWEHPVTLNLTNPSLRYDNNVWVVTGANGIFVAYHPIEDPFFSEPRKFYLDANPQIIGYRDPDHTPPEEVLPFLEGETGRDYLPIKDQIQVVGKMHVISEVIDNTGIWDIPYSDPSAISINQEGIISILNPDKVDPLYKIQFKSKYNNVFTEVGISDDIEIPADWVIRETPTPISGSVSMAAGVRMASNGETIVIVLGIQVRMWPQIIDGFGVITSLDNGTTWTPITLHPIDETIGLTEVDIIYGGGWFYIWAGPFDAGRDPEEAEIHIDRIHKVFRSRDGINWDNGSSMDQSISNMAASVKLLTDGFHMAIELAWTLWFREIGILRFTGGDLVYWSKTLPWIGDLTNVVSGAGRIAYFGSDIGYVRDTEVDPDDWIEIPGLIHLSGMFNNRGRRVNTSAYGNGMYVVLTNFNSGIFPHPRIYVSTNCRDWELRDVDFGISPPPWSASPLSEPVIQSICFYSGKFWIVTNYGPVTSPKPDTEPRTYSVATSIDLRTWRLMSIPMLSGPTTWDIREIGFGKDRMILVGGVAAFWRGSGVQTLDLN